MTSPSSQATPGMRSTSAFTSAKMDRTSIEIITIMGNSDDGKTNESKQMPAWAQGVAWLISTVGVPTFLLLWFAGAFDGFLPSPVHAALERHSKETVPVLRTVCKGVWKGNELMQQECEK